MAARNSPRDPGRRSLWPRVLLAMGATLFVLVALVMLEGVLVWLDAFPPPAPTAVQFTAIDRDVIRPDPRLLYRLPPSSSLLTYYRTNAFGYRGPELAVPKPDDVTRIVCIGDSCTFGLGVREEETYAAQLQQMLNVAFEGDARFEVATIGVPGYSTFQSRRQVEIEVPRLEADLVVVMPTGVNDASLSAGGSDAERAARYESWTFRVLQSRVLRMLGAAEPTVARAPAKFAAERKNGERPRVSLSEFDDNLRGAAAACRAQGRPLVVVAFELGSSVYARDPELRAREQIVSRRVAEDGVALADPRSAMREVAPYPVHVDNIHPSPRGHRAIAAAVFATLVERDDLLPATPRLRFLRRFLASGRSGVDEPSAWMPEGPPPMLAAQVEGSEAPSPDDPFLATGWRWLRRFDGGDDDGLIAVIEERARPFDPLRRFLFGTGTPVGPPSQETVRVARRLANLDAAMGLSSPPVDRRLGDAIEAANAGDPAASLRLLDEVLALDPRSTEALFRKVQTAWKSRRMQLALQTLDELRAVDPDHPYYLVAAGLLATERGRLDEALPLLERAVKLMPMSGDAHFALGYVRLKRGELQSAEDSFRVAAVILPSSYQESMAMIAAARQQGAESGPR